MNYNQLPLTSLYPHFKNLESAASLPQFAKVNDKISQLFIYLL